MPITFRDLAANLVDIDFDYQGHDVHIQFRADRVTKQFRAETLRLAREGARIQRRAEELTKLISTVVAPDGSDDAVLEDESAERAILQLQADDDRLKRQIDEIVCNIVSKWDVIGSNGKMLPLTPEDIHDIPPEFEKIIMEKIIERTAEGEAKAQPSMKPLLSISKPKDEQDT